MARYYYSAATCSWIDAATGLPEVDVIPVVAPTQMRSFFVGNRGYRFCNFMEVWIETNGRRIEKFGFASESAMYRGPSFGRIPSHAFDAKQEAVAEVDAVRFTQLVGARTVSPEVIGTGGGIVAGAILGGLAGSSLFGIGAVPGAIIGGIAGGVGGDTLAHQLVGFPPIWTIIEIRMFRDGSTSTQVLQHSIFPSMTNYVQSEPASSTPAAGYVIAKPRFVKGMSALNPTHYDATKDEQLPDWQKRGWGFLPASSTVGPCAGNPWGIEKGITGGSENLPVR